MSVCQKKSNYSPNTRLTLKTFQHMCSFHCTYLPQVCVADGVLAAVRLHELARLEDGPAEGQGLAHALQGQGEEGKGRERTKPELPQVLLNRMSGVYFLAKKKR